VIISKPAALCSLAQNSFCQQVYKYNGYAVYASCILAGLAFPAEAAAHACNRLPFVTLEQ